MAKGRLDSPPVAADPESSSPGWRRWTYPLAAGLLVPLLLLGLLEGGLRLAGYGNSTHFLIHIPGTERIVTNPRFGWRFFPPALARAPVVSSLPNQKAPGTYRIFLLGGSAAMGTPEPAFSFGRILEVMLEAVYPGVEFEVVNAAMAAVNSHVALEIARDCAAWDPDLFLIYLGNNEVVGPYGPGTTLRDYSPSRWLIRLGLRARRLRLVQLLEAAIAATTGGPPAGGGWRGMEMFLEHRVLADDPRLDRVYEHLKRNLTDVVEVAGESGAEVLLSTVAVNLRDSPPFASTIRHDLGEGERERWTRQYDRALSAIEEGRPADALASLRLAAELDGSHAELQFLLGHGLLVAGDPGEARERFERARDLDLLRFRADSRINQVVRQVAAEAERDGTAEALLVDAERALAEAARPGPGIPGSEYFHEHVHLRYGANYQLARAFAERIEGLLPAELAASRNSQPLPSPERCAEMLALTPRGRYRIAAAIYEMTARPPFTGQWRHPSRQRLRWAEVRKLRDQSRRSLQEEVAAHRRALERRPEDLHLLQGLAAALDAQGDHPAAARHWRRLIAEVPGVAAWHTSLAFSLEDAGETGSALAELERAADLEPQLPIRQVNLGVARESLGDQEAAAGHYTRALEIDPQSAEARFNLAHLLESQNRLEEALAQYRAVLDHAPDLAEAHSRLAEFLDRRGSLDEAVFEYREALRFAPESAAVRNNLAGALAALDRWEEAAAELRWILDRRPDEVAALSRLATVLLQADDREVRDATEALELAQRADRLPGGAHPEVQATLAAAYAANGQPGRALEILRSAIETARAGGEVDLVRVLSSRAESLARRQGPNP